jgi:hypothetical protein
MRLAFGMGCVALTLAFACSSKSSGSGGGGATTSSSFTQQYCQLLEPCCAQAGLSTTGALCESFAGAAFAQGTFDQASAQTCLAGIQAESSAGTFCTTLGNDIPACAQVSMVASGTTPPGGTCTDDSDCAKAAGGGATCFDQFNFDDGGTSQTQTCIQTLPGQAGQGPCIGVVSGDVTTYDWSGTGALPTEGVLCATADGLTCSSATQKCVALAAVGQACGQDSDCVTSAYCASGTEQQCTPRIADGASCTIAPDGCLTTSYCDSASSTCKPQLGSGSACTVDQQCTSGACINDACSGGSNDLALGLLCGTN